SLGWRRLGPSVKSRIARTEPRIERDSLAALSNWITPSMPLLGWPSRAILTGARGDPTVELMTLMLREPLAPFAGSKNKQAPLFPAGHATMSRGPMMLRSLVGTGLVTTT